MFNRRENSRNESMKDLINNIQSKEAVKEIIRNLYRMSNELESSISIIQTAFIYNTSLPLAECKGKLNWIFEKDTKLSGKLKRHAGDDDSLKNYISVPECLVRIAEDIRNLSELVDRKNREKVIFSDRAINESIYLMQRVMEIIKPTGDMILARNRFLAGYIHEARLDISRKANEFATLHEERLISGICVPSASSLYIDMLDALKNISLHTSDVSRLLLE